MSSYLLKSQILQGAIRVPSSKSQTLRAILFAALAKGKSIIYSPLISSDSLSMIEACRLFGAKIDVSTGKIEVWGLDGKIDRTEDVINAGNSGIVLRFCAAIGALASHPVVITGDHSIRHLRPMKALLNGLSLLGVSADSMRGDDFAPVIIKGPLKPGKTLLNGKDSQPVSALLIASAFVEGETEIDVKEPGEKPWIGMTLEWFDRLGVRYQNQQYEHYKIFGKASYEGFHYQVPGDWSSAAFSIAAALVTKSELKLQNIDITDLQGDKEILHVFEKMGAEIELDISLKELHIKNTGQLRGIKIDINNFVDAITIIAVVACFAEGETIIYNAQVAKKKECDRIECLALELRKMGADIQTNEQGLIIRGSALYGASLFSHHDHRMAMSLAVASLGASGISTIDSTDCVAKTYPTFIQDFNALGATIEVFE